MSNEILELSEEAQEEAKPTETVDEQVKEDIITKEGKKPKKEKAKPTENVDEAPKVNKDGFVAGQEVDSKSYFEFLAKQRNSQ